MTKNNSLIDKGIYDLLLEHTAVKHDFFMKELKTVLYECSFTKDKVTGGEAYILTKNCFIAELQRVKRIADAGGYDGSCECADWMCYILTGILYRTMRDTNALANLLFQLIEEIEGHLK